LHRRHHLLPNTGVAACLSHNAEAYGDNPHQTDCQKIAFLYGASSNIQRA